MKLKVLFFLLTVLGMNRYSYSQGFTLINGADINVMNNTVFFVNGLEFDSTSDFQITAPNNITRVSTPINAQSINRVITLDNAIYNYQGTLTLHYDDAELNGINENDLIMSVEDESNNRTTYLGTVDTFLNTLSFDFSPSINILSVTATDATALGLDSIDYNQVSFYPNPTTNFVNIVSNHSLKTEVFDVNGRKIIESNKKVIDISQFSTGTYLFKIRMDSNPQQKVFKILKY